MSIKLFIAFNVNIWQKHKNVHEVKLKNVKLRPLKGNKNPIRNRYHFKVTSSPFIHSYCVNVQFLWPLLTSE